jgi:hypothetical protein
MRAMVIKITVAHVSSLASFMAFPPFIQGSPCHD